MIEVDNHSYTTGRSMVALDLYDLEFDQENDIFAEFEGDCNELDFQEQLVYKTNYEVQDEDY